jgi:hypothetical protein
MISSRPTEAPLEGGKSSLGNTTKSASVYGITKSENPTDKRYRLQRKAQQLLPSERVATCMHTPKFNSDVSIVVKEDSAWFSGTMVCGSVWHCPVCAARVGVQRAEELRIGITNWLQASKTVVLVTYTLKHSAFDSVSESLDTLKAALRRMKSGREFQDIKHEFYATGTIKNIEVTHGKNGWHPHAHELWFLDKPLPFTVIDHLESRLQERWLHVLGIEGGEASRDRGLTAKSARKDIYDYVAKFGRMPTNPEASRLEYELTHSHSKTGRVGGETPWALLDRAEAGDKQAGALFREYAHAFKGTKQLHYSRGLKELLGIDNLTLTDQEAAEAEEEESELFYTFTRLEWRCVIEYDERAFALELARKRSKERLRTLLAALCNRKVKSRL